MIFFKHTDCLEGKVIFEALENGHCLGKCTLIIKDSIADVTELTYDEGFSYAAEGLLRSAYNYAALKNYYLAKCSAKNIDSVLDKMNFKKENGEYISDIPTILMGSCCK